jgi:hypothetical protein
MTSTIKISRTAVEGMNHVMRWCQSIVAIGLALIGSAYRAVAVAPHDAENLQHHDDPEHEGMPIEVGAWHDMSTGGMSAELRRALQAGAVLHAC